MGSKFIYDSEDLYLVWGFICLNSKREREQCTLLTRTRLTVETAMFFRNTKMEEQKESSGASETAENKGTIFILNLTYRQKDIISRVAPRYQ